MSNPSTYFSRFPIIPRFWKPAAVTGAGGTAPALWFDETVKFSHEILVPVFLIILAGMIYLLNIFIFKSHIPRREDMEKTNDKGAKK
jgi:hypothetical protein